MDTQLDESCGPKYWLKRCRLFKKYYGQTVVVKYGGNAMINEELNDAVIHDLVLLNLVGVKVVVVHGGGPEISDMLKRSARSPALSMACATPTARPWTSCRWCSAARSTRIW